MASSSVGTIVTWGIIGLAGWWIYENFFANAGTPGSAGGSTGAGGGSQSSGAGSGSSGGTSAPVLASMFSALQAQVEANAVANGGTYSLNPDQFNYYLAKAVPNSPKAGATWPPDPLQVFPGVDRMQLMTITQYWSGMSAFLSHNFGLSGLGVFAGLGMIAAANRGWPEMASGPWFGGARRAVQ